MGKRSIWMAACLIAVISATTAAQEATDEEFEFLEAEAPTEPEFGAFDEMTEDFSFEEDGNVSADGRVRRVRHRFVKTGLQFAGLTPLADPLPPRVTHAEAEAVVVSVPVLLAKDGRGSAPPYRLDLDLYLGTQRVTSLAQVVTPQSISRQGPSYAMFTAWVPTRAPKGTLRAVLRQTSLAPIAEGEALPPAVELYTVESVFHRPVSVEEEVTPEPTVTKPVSRDDGFGDGFLDDDDDLEFED